MTNGTVIDTVHSEGRRRLLEDTPRVRGAEGTS
jgi:hypothetical protein